MTGPMARGPMRAGTKEKFDAKALKKIFIYCKPYLPAIILSIIFAVIGAITTIIGPDKISELMNIITGGIISGIDMTEFAKTCIFLICLYAGGSLFSYLQQYIMAIITQKASKSLRSDIDKKINKLPLSYFDKTTRGDILSRITNDVDTISQTLGSSLANLISAVVLFVGVTVMMFLSNWVLALVTIAASLLGFVLMAVILANSQKYFNKKQVLVGDLNGQVEEVYTNLKVVKSYGAVNNEVQKFGNKNEQIANVDFKSQFLSGMMMPIMTFVGNLSYVLIFVVGVSIILGGGTTVTIGTLVSFVIYAKLFSQPLGTFAQSMSSLQQASAASKRVFEVLDAQEMQDESHKTAVLPQIVGNVKFENVKFGYEKDKTIIHNFCANLKAGQKVAIVGPTGAGKTTIVNLLMRFYEMDSGDIVIDGVSIKDLKRTDVHSTFPF